ncbi:M1 family metallopeptidase [Streptomyces sp. S3(2020)]|uniref:M1 family metallopeptidase n=1 Tax=Streptomyces sp. S3(2020) TaxID=2732044 RepID=UPI00148A056D|nr:M1 family metallopeptidase [Streptomyces sp. S3(2020)]NNN29704.1 M1 family metallopeptidase [Streptomyces sp. S3(2020)]
MHTETDPHSWLRPGMPRTTHVDWDATVDFERKRLRCSVTLTFDHADGGEVVLDTRQLRIHGMARANGEPLAFTVGETDEVLGEPLRFELPAGDDTVRIDYETTEDATALQWLAPEQTSAGTHDFLFSQCQTIHARSMIPLHDSMSAKVGFHARVTVPDGYTALMSAKSASETASPADGTRTYEFEAPQPRPPYLIVLVVGNVTSRRIGPRSLIWAEPDELPAAAEEFSGVEDLLVAAENLYGPYPWGDLDLIVMPPSYPYGGLENPGLTFLSPTLVLGDKSEVGVLSHEIAHHWSGDLVTGHSMNHFWVNEGFTTYAERRITEATVGVDVADLWTALAIDDLRADFAYFAENPELTRLRKDLTGQDPDTTSSWVAHEKGGLFLRALEEKVGRERFDAFFKQFFADFAYRSLTTEEFLEYIDGFFPGAIDYREWLYGDWLPADTPKVASRFLTETEAVGQGLPGAAQADWTAEHWKAYLRRLTAPKDADFLETLDRAHALTTSVNLEIRVAWLTLGVRSGYAPAVMATAELLAGVGRMKYLKVLYDALADREETLPLALSTYRANRGFYHPIARTVVESRFEHLGIAPSAYRDDTGDTGDGSADTSEGARV